MGQTLEPGSTIPKAWHMYSDILSQKAWLMYAFTSQKLTALGLGA